MATTNLLPTIGDGVALMLVILALTDLTRHGAGVGHIEHAEPPRRRDPHSHGAHHGHGGHRTEIVNPFLELLLHPADESFGAVKKALAQYPTQKVETKSEYLDSVNKMVDQILMMFYGLLAMSVIISIFGIVNTLVLSISERTRSRSPSAVSSSRLACPRTISTGR